MSPLPSTLITRDLLLDIVSSLEDLVKLKETTYGSYDGVEREGDASLLAQARGLLQRTSGPGNGPDGEQPVGYLHIFAQSHWHDSACIAGDRKGFEMLGTAISSVLAGESGRADLNDVFVNDGEGYEINLYRIDDVDTLMRLAAPYTDEMARPRPDALWPWQLPLPNPGG